MAKLYFRYGAMNSGKSTAILQVAYNYKERGMRVAIIKPETDSKGENKIISRLGKARNVDILVNKSMDVFKTISDMKNRPDCILADEAQFFSPKQIDQFFNISVDLNISVICYGLRTDFKRNSFPGSRRLFELAHSLEELKTICRCGKKAIFNGRKLNGKYVFKGSQVAIDGESEITYESLCGNCYNRESLAR